jgi:uncharacterized repeat protein (TIGR01451 family)
MERCRRIPVIVAALAAAVCVSVANGADSPLVSRPAIDISINPKVQTLQTMVRHQQPVFGTARFTITVSNPSPVRLAAVHVADHLAPRCNRAIGSLAAGASIAYSCSAPNVLRSYTNVATVSTHRPQGVRNPTSVEAAVTDTATSQVRVTTKVTAASGAPAFTG